MPKPFDEIAWVEFLRTKLKRNNRSVSNIGDDCAVIKGKEEYYLISSDLFVENVHFQRGKTSFFDIGRRAVARAISDIAACAGEPKFINVCIGIPVWLKVSQLKRIMKGIVDCADAHNTIIIGGDTSSSAILFLDISVVGKTRSPILRSGAKEGDYIFLTGRLGELRFNKAFRARVKEAEYLAKRFKINAMIDISDGFIIDLYRIIKASEKGALIFKEKIPVFKDWNDVYRGEDYELIFTVDEKEPNLEKLFSKFFCVGRIKPKKFGYKIQMKEKLEKVVVKGFQHF